MTDTTPEMKEYAATAGLLPQDMPPANHPLFENNADVRDLADLIDARSEGASDDNNAGDRVNDGATGKTAFDAMDDDDSYLTRADFEDSMLGSDPDSDAGDDDGTMDGVGMDRMPDITGTVRGLAPGMGTHMPLDLGAGGFQIIEPEDAGDLSANATAEYPDTDAEDGSRIDITPDAGAMSADDALDGTRRLR